MPYAKQIENDQYRRTTNYSRIKNTVSRTFTAMIKPITTDTVYWKWFSDIQLWAGFRVYILALKPSLSPNTAEIYQVRKSEGGLLLICSARNSLIYISEDSTTELRSFC